MTTVSIMPTSALILGVQFGIDPSVDLKKKRIQTDYVSSRLEVVEDAPHCVLTGRIGICLFHFISG